MPDLKLAIIPVTPFQQNCSLLWDEDDKTCVLVDPGGEPEEILAAIRTRGLTVTMILLTHGHLDHAGGAKAVKAALDAEAPPVPLIGPDARDAFLLDGIEDSARQFRIPGLQNVRPDRFVVEGETVGAGPFAFEVLHCPGHSPGSVVYFSPTLRFAFVGDVIFRGGVGRTDFPYGDGPALIAAIREKLLPLGDDVQFICGHGPGSDLGTERRSNPFIQEGA